VGLSILLGGKQVTFNIHNSETITHAMSDCSLKRTAAQTTGAVLKEFPKVINLIKSRHLAGSVGGVKDEGEMLLHTISTTPNMILPRAHIRLTRNASKTVASSQQTFHQDDLRHG
jgi:hypothetical protein